MATAIWQTLTDRTTWVGVTGTAFSFATLERIVGLCVALASFVYVCCRIYYIIRNNGKEK